MNMFLSLLTFGRFVPKIPCHYKSQTKSNKKKSLQIVSVKKGLIFCLMLSGQVQKRVCPKEEAGPKPENSMYYQNLQFESLAPVWVCAEASTRLIQ